MGHERERHQISLAPLKLCPDIASSRVHKVHRKSGSPVYASKSFNEKKNGTMWDGIPRTGMPQEHEIPAPVTTTMRLLLATESERLANVRRAAGSENDAERSNVVTMRREAVGRWE